MSGQDSATTEAKAKKSFLDMLESWSKIIAAIAIPVVIAIGGWIIQDSVSKQSTSKDYVNLALSLLQKKPQTEEERRLTSWAVDLMNHSSPVKFDEDTTKLLKSGEIDLGSTLTAVIRAAGSGGGGFAISPDSKLLAIGGQDKLIRIFDLATGKPLSSIAGHMDTIYALAFSPDGKRLASGSADKTARIFDILTANQLRLFQLPNAVIGIGYFQDGRKLAIRDLSTIYIFDVDDGREVQRYPVERQ